MALILNGSPLKSQSRPAQITRTPRLAKSSITLIIPSSKNWTSSIQTASIPSL